MNNTLHNTSINILQNLLLQNESIKRQNTGSLFNITSRKNSSFCNLAENGYVNSNDDGKITVSTRVLSSSATEHKFGQREKYL